MDTHSDKTKRIAKNTLMLYARMLFGMFVSLYTSRVILNALGVEDYGIYNVVGGFVGMFSMISGSLSASVSRFLTFELGKGDMVHLKETFSTSLLIHFALAGIVLVLTESVGIWFLNTRMTIPADRLYAANWVFQASILGFICSILSVPYNASIVSHERMTAFAYIGIFDIVMRLVIILFVAYAPWQFDRLIVYSLLLLGLSLFMRGIYWFYCRKNFEECHVRLHFNKKCWKDISAFAGWNFIGSISGLLKGQGVNVLLNLFIGPVVNAARGISDSVNNAVCSFAGNFMTALNPQITKSFASGDRDYMLSLVERGARFSFYIILLMALPILLETDFVLTLWLKTFPEHTVNFVRLVLLLSLCDILSNTLVTLQLATGKIRNYQLAVGGMQLMNFPVSYGCLYAGLSPESTYVAAIVISFLCLLLRLSFLRKPVGLSIRNYLQRVVCNAGIVAIVAAVLPVLFRSCLSEGWYRFIGVVLVSVISVCMTSCFLGCNRNERHFIRTKLVALKTKFFK